MALKEVPIDGEPTAPTAARSSSSARGLALGLLCSAALLAGCQGGGEARIRRAYDLGRRPSEPNKNRIEAMLADQDRDVRTTVLVVMESIDPARAARLAAIAIDDPDGYVRAAAVKILGAEAAGDPALVRRLAALAGGDAAWQVRRQALEAIAPVDDPVVRDAFASALSDSVRHVRRTALSCGKARPGFLPLDRVSALIVDDPDWENRVEAARVLGGSKDPAAYAGLDQAAGDPNEFVRAAVAAERRGLLRAGVPEVTPPPPEAKPAKPGSGV